MENKEINELVKEYFVKGGKSINIIMVDVYRDGGTIGIKWNYFGGVDLNGDDKEYYVDKDLTGLYRAFKKEDEVTDKAFKAYFIECLERYVGHLQFKVKMCNNAIEAINK